MTAGNTDLKLTIERAALLSLLNHTRSVVEARNTIPILSNVLLRADGEALHITATDMDIEVVESCPAVVSAPGVATVPAGTLYDIVRKLPNGEQISMELDAGKHRVTLKAGRSKFVLGALSAEDFPVMGMAEVMTAFDIPADDLKALLDRTKFAMSNEQTRFMLNGIYLHAKPAERLLRAAATDGHRLARVEVPLPDGAADMPGIILPRKTVGELRKLLEEAAGDVRMAVSSHKIRIEVSGIVITSKLIDGTFPDYERVIPTGNEHRLTVDAKEFAKAVDRVATVSTEKSRAVKLSLSDSALKLSATNSDGGAGDDELDVEYGAPAMTVGFNAKYLLETLQQIDGVTVRFDLHDTMSPVIVTDPEAPEFLGVIMPLRI